MLLQIFLLLVYATRNTGDVMSLYINSLKPVFSKPEFKTCLRFCLTIKSQIDFFFQNWPSLTVSCLKNIYLEVFTQSSLMKNIFTCAGVYFLVKLQAGGQLKKTKVQVFTFDNFLLRVCNFQEHLFFELPTSSYFCILLG